jgi:hypothetical protein
MGGRLFGTANSSDELNRGKLPSNLLLAKNSTHNDDTAFAPQIMRDMVSRATRRDGPGVGGWRAAPRHREASYLGACRFNNPSIRYAPHAKNMVNVRRRRTRLPNVLPLTGYSDLEMYVLSCLWVRITCARGDRYEDNSYASCSRHYYLQFGAACARN